MSLMVAIPGAEGKPARRAGVYPAVAPGTAATAAPCGTASPGSHLGAKNCGRAARWGRPARRRVLERARRAVWGAPLKMRGVLGG